MSIMNFVGMITLYTYKRLRKSVTLIIMGRYSCCGWEEKEDYKVIQAQLSQILARISFHLSTVLIGIMPNLQRIMTFIQKM